MNTEVTPVMVTLAIPLTPEVWGHLRIPHPMTEDQWFQMLRTLDAMRPGIVSSPGLNPDPAE